jgi:hypothetical protein
VDNEIDEYDVVHDKVQLKLNVCVMDAVPVFKFVFVVVGEYVVESDPDTDGVQVMEVGTVMDVVDVGVLVGENDRVILSELDIVAVDEDECE